MNPDPTNQIDEELSNLLDDALNDFEESESVNSNNDSCSKNLNSTDNQVKLDPVLDANCETFNQNLFFDKLKELYGNNSESNNELDFAKSLQEAIEQSTSFLKNFNQEDFNEESTPLWNDLLLNNKFEESDLMSLISNMMQDLLSKDIFYPSIKSLSEKYPEWLEQNKDKLEKHEYDRYVKQLKLMQKVCVQFESQTDIDDPKIKAAQFEKIFSIVKEMKESGSPPQELTGYIPDVKHENFDNIDLKSCCLM